jgi:rhamnosyltransferase
VVNLESRQVGSLAIYATIVLYNPELARLLEVLIAVSKVVDGIFLIDNNSRDNIDEFLQQASSISAVINKIKLTKLTENIGLASGLNTGIRQCLAAGASHVLMLDQDTIPQPGMMDSLLAAMEYLENQGISVAAVGPRFFDPRSQETSNFKSKQVIENADCSYYKESYLQSSGSLITSKTLAAVGLMDDSLFIHHIDQEWCLRSQQLGYASFGVSDALMDHVIGDQTKRLWVGHWHDVHIHKPMRQYFAFRNSIMLYKRRYMPWRWILEDFARLVFMLVFYMVFVNEKLANAQAIFKGIRDGLLTKTNPQLDRS